MKAKTSKSGALALEAPVAAAPRKGAAPPVSAARKSREDFIARVKSISRKELRHIVRDPFTLGMALGLPLVMLVLFGFAIDFDVRDIALTVIDRDQTKPSREMVDTIQGTGLFKVKYGSVEGPPTADLDHEMSKGVLIIEKGFGEDLRANHNPKMQLLMDGADNSVAGTIGAYLAGLVPAAWARLSADSPQGPPPKPPLSVRIRFLFNPELNSHWFMIPALSALIMGLVSSMLTAVTVAREWENGSMELLLSTPVRPLEIIIGKLLPYLVLGLGAAGAIFISALTIFGVPFHGSLLLYAFSCLLFLVPCLAIGLIISVKTRQQQMAMQTTMMITMLPNMMLSGFIFPVESMPKLFYLITFIIPGRWFIMLSRSLFLKTPGISELAIPLIVLLAWNFFFIRMALKNFKTDLEP
jgi:ABC-2 type transport system permease protein